MMLSTRQGYQVSIEQAVLDGLAADGGLYVPEHLPQYEQSQFSAVDNLAEFAYQLLDPYFHDSAIALSRSDCQDIFNFAMPLTRLASGPYLLELFHGPTLSFKDFGARFFAHCLEQLAIDSPIKVIVATSGDTGSAVASALYGKQHVDGYILFPQGKISLRQQQQITCWQDNIHAFAVEGNFDDCQRMLKTLIAEGLDGVRLTTANSINIARLLPQQLFYAYTSTQIARQQNSLVNFVVPSGNQGNVVSCYWARAAGFPIGNIYIATNANDVLSQYLQTGVYQAQPSKVTLANAMDVGNPSNLERLIHLFGDFKTFKQSVQAKSVSDPQIEQAIVAAYEQDQVMICPHTATAYAYAQSLPTRQPLVIAATAHPAKFETVVEPLVHSSVPIPENLQSLLDRPAHVEKIRAEMNELRHAIK